MERITRAAAVLGIRIPRPAGRLFRQFSVWLFALSVSLLPVSGIFAAGTLTNASVALTDPRPNATSVGYSFTGSSVDGATVVRCVKVVWSTTSAGTIAPTGFNGAPGSVNAAASTLINSSATGWSLAKSDGTSSSGQNNIYQYTNTTGVTPSTTTGATFALTGLTNSSLADTTYFFKLFTFSNTNCSTGAIDNVTVQFINTNGSTLSLTVDQSLSFTVAGVGASTSCDGTTTTSAATATTLPFGNVTTASNAVVCQDLAAATNATNGYSIFVRYTGKPSNGVGGLIADHTGTNAAPTAFSAAGTEAYGYTTNDSTLAGTNPTANRFTSPAQNWAAATTSNAEIGYSPVGSTATTYRIGHQVGIANTTPAGNYQTTIIYTCTPVY